VHLINLFIRKLRKILFFPNTFHCDPTVTKKFNHCLAIWVIFIFLYGENLWVITKDFQKFAKIKVTYVQHTDFLISITGPHTYWSHFDEFVNTLLSGFILVICTFEKAILLWAGLPQTFFIATFLLFVVYCFVFTAYAPSPLSPLQNHWPKIKGGSINELFFLYMCRYYYAFSFFNCCSLDQRVPTGFNVAWGFCRRLAKSQQIIDVKTFCLRACKSL